MFKAPEYAFILILPVLGISYYRVIIKRDISTVLILMLSSRLIMGPFIINSNLAFNVLNLACNYIPLFIILTYQFSALKRINIQKIIRLKWTILFLTFMLLFSMYHFSYAISEFTAEILPLFLFLLVILSNIDEQINYHYLLRFFRYSFAACIVIYITPDFYNQMYYLFEQGVIFKEATPSIALQINRSIPRNTGFVFDFRIMGQLACLYLILLYYLNKTKSFWDVVLLTTVAVLTFSRGPLMILTLLLLAVYLPQKVKITKRLVLMAFTSFILIMGSIIYTVNNETLQNFVGTINPLGKKNAFSQRSAFTDYSLNKFYEDPLGNGIGALSSPKAENRIYAGLTNLHKEIPDKVYYYRVTDTYLAMSLAEKGIIGFILFALSFKEIFYSNRNRVSLFFILGLTINLLGTDIPKQGFYYFVIIIVYYGLSQSNIKQIKYNKI